MSADYGALENFEVRITIAIHAYFGECSTLKHANCQRVFCDEFALNSSRTGPRLPCHIVHR